MSAIEMLQLERSRLERVHTKEFRQLNELRAEVAHRELLVRAVDQAIVRLDRRIEELEK